MKGTKHGIVSFDLIDHANFNVLLERITVYTKRLDGVVHCAGLQIYEPLRFIAEDSIQKIFQLNIISPTLLTKAIRRGRFFNENSSIIFLTSVAGLIGAAGASIYAASKAAIVALTKSLAVELASESIRVNCIAPAVVKTAMSSKMFATIGKEQTEIIEQKHLLGLGEPEDIASIIAFLLSDATKWITGSCIVADGGYSLNK